MQVTFDTNNAADCAFVRGILGIAAPETPASAPAPAVAPIHHLGPLLTGPTWPIPANAPAGSQWVNVVGAGGETPTLCGADGQPLPGYWAVPPQPVPGFIGSTSSPNLTGG